MTTIGFGLSAGRGRLARILVACALALAAAIAVIVVVAALSRQRADALVIDLAGRQRSLSERLVKNVVLALSTQGSAGAADFDATRLMLMRSADRLISGGEIQLHGRLRTLPASAAAIRPRLEKDRDALARQVAEALEILSMAESAGGIDGQRHRWDAFIELSDDLRFELDETVRVLSETSEAETRSALLWATVGASLVVLLSLSLLWQTLRSDELSERLRESDERLELAVLGSNDGLWYWDVETDEVHYSSRFRELLGVTAEEFPRVADSIRSRVHPDDRDRVFAAFDSHMRDQTPFDEDCRLRHRSGEHRFFRVRGRARFDERGRAVRMAGAITDVSAQKAAEATLEKQAREAELVHLATSMAAETESFEAALQSSADSVCEATGWPVGHAYVPDRDDRRRLLLPTTIWHLAADEAYREFREVTERTTFEPGVGLPGRIWSSGEPAWIRNVQEDDNFPRALLCDELGVRGAFGFPILVRGELVAVLEFFAAEEMEPDPDLLRAVASVGEQVGRVLERQRSRDELRLARDAAEEANRAKSQFLANMSHELRTPLNSVIGFSNVLLRALTDRVPDKERTYLERIRDNGIHLLSLINEVLDISKIEAGRMELDVTSVDVAAVVADVCAGLEVTSTEKGLRLESSVPEDLNPILADAARLKQVLINLVANALKFTDEGGVTIRVQAIGESKEPASLEVIDTGIGIAEEQLPTVFDTFRQADGSTTRRFSGSGLGLTISRSLCRLMGFELSVASEKGRGSTFTVSFEGARGYGGGEPVSTDSLEPLAAGHRVLVIDDDPDTRILLGEYLNEMGCEVIAAPSGEDGLSLARRQSPDLITLDLMMPGMNGWEVLHRLKSDPALADIPVVVVSVVASENRGALLGAVDTLSKPIERSGLQRVLARSLDRRPRRALVLHGDSVSRARMVELLTEEGLEAVEARDEREAFDSMSAQAPDLVILDLINPEMDGTGFLARLRELPGFVDLPVVLVASNELSSAEIEELERRGAEVLKRGDALEKRLKKAVLSRLRGGQPARYDA